MTIIKVLGVGSPFGDDQVGWKVVEELKHQLSIDTDVSPFVVIERCDRPGVRLIELMSGFNTVFIIDAVKSGNAIGTIHRFQKEALLDSAPGFSTHDLGIIQALQLASALNELPDNLLFYGIEIDVITFDTTLSLHVENAITDLALQLKNEIVAWVQR
ncbi:hydrogenase expression/formation protein [Legionella steigerwaltii]|uniref:Hydrogenase expression/formation protein n=1 Tax=Legionella steigerwaltii TaxID=460 RepID=A0A378L6I4_9GAMM|nr:hydrogenase maturation protease [Legionella steigerwaltii]KTD80262.1 hydrogenase expression/formation protein [Legionella steigerwaltii]STY22344.1 hydrogenase expression/formation protein [Legionella steigerwaltii]